MVATLVLLFIPKHQKNTARWFATGAIISSFLLSVFIFSSIWGKEEYLYQVNWLTITSSIQFKMGIFVNDLTALFLLIVTGISSLVHIYSGSYMYHDPRYTRFFTYLIFFTFTMIGICVADNLLMLFIFWELVGFSSYLLIGFWFEKPLAAAASKKAFIVNRIGDAGFLAGIFIMYAMFQSFDFHHLIALFEQSKVNGDLWVFGETTIHKNWLIAGGLLFFLGAIGKSAQFPLFIWLPNAMQGPTPVSALIHAATMVAAGVFLIARTYTFFIPEVLFVVALLGALTAFIGSFAASSQFDIKKILAYSTISQLGYMTLAMGVGAYGASIFHFTTHALFKAGLFLGGGLIVHQLGVLKKELINEGVQVDLNLQNIKIMGGLRKRMPQTFWAYMLVTAGAAGLPLTAGFVSKDEILTASVGWAMLNGHEGLTFFYIIPILTFAATLLTSFYIGRQFFLVFFGDLRLSKYLLRNEANKGKKEQIDKCINKFFKTATADKSLKYPIFLLATFSAFFFFSFNPIDGAHSWIMSNISEPHFFQAKSIYDYHIADLKQLIPQIHLPVVLISILLGIIGFGLSYILYGRKGTNHTYEFNSKLLSKGSFINKISFNAFYIDSISLKFVQKIFMPFTNFIVLIEKSNKRAINNFGIAVIALSRIAMIIDKYIIDGLVKSSTLISFGIGTGTAKMQGGKLRVYIISAFTILLIGCFIALFILT